MGRVEIFMKVYLLSWCNPSKLSHSPSAHQNIYQHNIVHNSIYKSQSALKKMLKNRQNISYQNWYWMQSPNNRAFSQFISCCTMLCWQQDLVLMPEILCCLRVNDWFFCCFPPSPYMWRHLCCLSYLKTVSFECIC